MDSAKDAGDDNDRLIRRVRKEYLRAGLLETNAPESPLSLFELWFTEAVESGLVEPNGMTLATADADGRPAARIVLLKEFDELGFVFFTNYDSRKGVELAQNPQAALVFWWIELERQVRIEGRVTRVPAAESDAYFNSRPRGSQIGAWISSQSQVISSRQVLEERHQDLLARYASEEPISRPDHWGGYRLIPEMIEFWQGRPNRLHDRLRYIKEGSGVWRVERLAP